MRRWKRATTAASLLVAFAWSASVEASDVTVGGTGMALATMSRVAEAVRAQTSDIEIKVLPSMGSGGGLKALRDGVIDLSLSARRLKANEVEVGLREAFCFKTALIFATQQAHVSNIDLRELPGIYRKIDPRWPDGAPLKIVLRAASGSEMPYLSDRVEGLHAAFEAAKARPEVPIGITDQMNLDIAEDLEGALAITTLLQIVSERRALSAVPVNGVLPSPDSLADGTYPFDMKVCVVEKKGKTSAPAQAVLDFLTSDAGRAVVGDLGALPVE